MQTGTILDFYDDPMGSVLKTKVAHAQLPDFIRKADYQTEEKLAALPDDAFALIMVDNGKAMRKFACVDKGNTALSVLYFMENKDKLPEEAQKVAAANLYEYCLAFGIEPPSQLEKIATRAEALLKGFHFRSNNLKDSFDPAIHDLVNRGIVHHEGRIAGRAGEAFQKGKSLRGIQEETFPRLTKQEPVRAIDRFKAGKTKQSDLTGSQIMPLQSNPNKADDPDSQLNATKTADMMIFGKLEDPAVQRAIADHVRETAKSKGMRPSDLEVKKASALYVDVTGKEPAPQFVKKAHSNYALHKYGQGRFPLDSYGDVLEANRWFEENGKTLHPSERQEYCTKLAARADSLGISVTSTIRKYASSTFAPAEEVRAAVSTRMQFWQSDAPERDMLQGMIDKYASVSPDVFCEALNVFDTEHGLDPYWDDLIVDPWASTYGMAKTAEWEWEQGGDRLTEDVLKQGVRDGQKIHQIETKFGKCLASEIVENPNTVFDSLPLDSKRIIARILNDSQ